MVLKLFLMSAVLTFCLFPSALTQAVSLEIIINEIAWMGNENSPNDEWIELYNNKEKSINLDGWILKADDGTPEINLSGIITAKGFHLLERTDDETVPGIPANLIYTGALGNNGEHLKLYDNLGNLIDEVNCSDAWFAGDNKTKQTMERTGVGEWQTSKEPGGTPKAENSKLTETRSLLDDRERVSEEASKPAEVGPPPAYPERIVFNEILPSPEGPDATEEWVELYNQNDFEVDLSNWTIQDTTGSTKTYILNSKIPALGYLVLKRPETKITLNNDGDGLILMNPSAEVIDSITFEKAFLGQSYNRTQSGWFWSTNLTPGAKNIIPVSKTIETKQEAQEKKSAETGPLQTADIGKTITKLAESSKPPVLLIAFIVAIFSATVLLVVKNSLS